MSHIKSEVAVEKYLSDHGFRCVRFEKSAMRSPAPDFRVFLEDEFRFYCEVKEIAEDSWLKDQLRRAPTGTIAGGSRKDPVYNRISDDIHQAVRQFDSVNRRPEHPNVLAFVNNDDDCSIDDVISVMTGNFYADDGSIHPIYRQFSEGRIKDEKLRVHLFLWFEGAGSPRFYFTGTDEAHHLSLCEWFGKNPDRLRRIPAF